MLRLLVYFCCFGLFVSCAHQTPEAPEPTQLEIREFQTRTFEVNDYAGVMKSVLDVLQDDGYMVKNVSSDLGFLSAVKEVGFNRPYWASRASEPRIRLAGNVGFGVGFGLGSRFGQERRYAAHQAIEATINVSRFGEKVRVRASFQSKVFDNTESVMSVRQIVDEEFYQTFFAKVDKGIFIQREAI